MRKKILIILLVIVLAISITACGRFSGTWYDINSIDAGYYLEFVGRNKAVLGTTNNSQGIAVPYSIEGDSLLITVPSTQITYRFRIVKIDGITHLDGSLSGQTEFDFVPADYYELLKANQFLPDPTPLPTPEAITPSGEQDAQPAETLPAPDEPPAEIPSEPDAGEPEASVPVPDEDGWYYDLENVTAYLMAYGKLPSNYITKREAEGLGWSGGSVQRYREGAAIGGGRFGNYEGLLPDGKYTECDIDTDGASGRGAKRLVFSTDGRYFYTDDHYETFAEVTFVDGRMVLDYDY